MPVPCHRIAFAFTIACQPLEASRSAYTTGDPFVYLFLLQVCVNSLDLLLPTTMMIFVADGTYFALLENFGDSPSFVSSFDLWVPGPYPLQVLPRRCKLLPRIRRSVLLRSHSKCLRIQSLSKQQPCVNCEPQDVEALLNGGSLIDAPCISVPEEHLLQAICRSHSWLQF